MPLIWAPKAADAFAAAVRYIAADHPGTAARWASGLLTATRRLERFPRSGRIVPELGRDEYREVLYGEFRIIYRVDSEAVVILTVSHGRRLLEVTEITES